MSGKLITLLVLAAAGCGTGPRTDPDAAVDVIPEAAPDSLPDPPPDPEADEDEDEPEDSLGVHGLFEVRLQWRDDDPTRGDTFVSGGVYDGPMPSGIILEEIESSGGCDLLGPRVPFCEEPCGSDAVCVEDGECQPYPSAVNAGTVWVEGLETAGGESALIMELVDDAYRIVAGSRPLFPPFSEGDLVTFSVGGSTTAPSFTMTARAIAPLRAPDTAGPMEDGEPMTLTWTPPEHEDIAHVLIVVNISQHGGTRGLVWCEVADTGSFEIPAMLLDGLKALGISGFPKAMLTRISTGTTDPRGPVTLVVRSGTTVMLSIPGLISCITDHDCPPGQTCQPDFRCE